jgi:hypothetical protein
MAPSPSRAREENLPALKPALTETRNQPSARRPNVGSSANGGLEDAALDLPVQRTALIAADEPARLAWPHKLHALSALLRALVVLLAAHRTMMPWAAAVDVGSRSNARRGDGLASGAPRPAASWLTGTGIRWAGGRCRRWESRTTGRCGCSARVAWWTTARCAWSTPTSAVGGVSVNRSVGL